MNAIFRTPHARSVSRGTNAPLSPVRLAVSIGLAAAASLAVASERDLGAHEHGAAALDVAVDGERLYVDLSGPADNVLGFEHAPSTDAQRATVVEAERLLGSTDLFMPNAEAGCTLEEAMVDIALPTSDEDAHGHDDDHDADGGHGEEHHDEDIDTHGDEHDEDHDAEGEHHDDDAHEDEHDEHAGETHSDMTAAHVFVCDDPGALDALATTLFERFDGFVDIDVQLVGPGGQDGARLTADAATLSLEAIR